MCLVTNNEIEILTEDKVFYKVGIDSERFFISLYQRFYFPYEVLYKVTIEIVSNDYDWFINHKYIVNEGFHMFVKEEDAKKWTEHQNLFYSPFTNKTIYTTCTVPKGSEVIYGVWRDDETVEQVVSNQIIIHKP